MATIHLRRETDVVWRQIDDYGVLLKVGTGDYCEVNELGLFVWNLLENEMTLEAVAARVAEEFEAPEDVLTADVMAFATDLEKRGMLVIGR